MHSVCQPHSFIHRIGVFALLVGLTVNAVAQEDNRLKAPVTKVVGDEGYKLPVLFGEVAVPGAGAVQKDGKRGTATIDVRTYGVADVDENADRSTPLIPGATFVFRPGDTLNLKLENYLNRSANPALNTFENNPQQGAPGKADDITGHSAHEISIPNNGDMTNLHVHGLHVDPKQDNVTLIVLPEDGDPSNLTPDIQRLVPTINRWWTRPYRYKIPEDHVPGTFWYHAHKHGATATQVENGMAGTLLMRPSDEADAIVPGLWNDDPAKSHDRVLVLQGLLNVGGTSQGAGQGLFAGQGLGGPVGVVNGQHMPTLVLPHSQLERWRFIFAGANHKGAGSIWVGKVIPSLSGELLAVLKAITDQASAEPYLRKQNPQRLPAKGHSIDCVDIPGVVQLATVDGVPMWKSVPITARTPSFGAPGNRNDIFIRVDASAQKSGPYNVYMNYPLTLPDIEERYKSLFDGAEGQWRRKVLQRQLSRLDYSVPADIPNNFTADPYGLSLGDPSGPTFDDFTPYWMFVDENNVPVDSAETNTGQNPSQMPVTPLIDGQPVKTTNGIQPRIRAQRFPEDLGWQPASAGAGQPMSAGIIMQLEIAGEGTDPPDVPASNQDFVKYLDQRLTLLSPATHRPSETQLRKLNGQGQLVKGIPSYVAPFSDTPGGGIDFDNHQVVVFDRGQFTFSYLNKSNGLDLEFRQFWLNGRQFSPDDFVGNPMAQDLIQAPLVDVEPALGSYSPNAAEQLWTHKIGQGADSHLLVVNPGYYLPLEALPATVPVVNLQTNKVTGQEEVVSYRYRTADSDTPAPTYAHVTGLTAPQQPVSTTREEWLLVNNSDMFHPFHIHISPFFVEEIGQLAYDKTGKEGEQWSFNNLSESNSPFKWVAGNWWDVIVIPPHGYVKFRTWMNVPVQLPANTSDPNSPLVSIEDANVYGSWVLHCHILRHEDRGMMTMVNTRPALKSLSGKWMTSNGNSVTVSDDSGQLVVRDGQPDMTIGGTFNEGLGNPFMTQPWAGALQHQYRDPNTAEVFTRYYTFNVTRDLSELVRSDGVRWTRSEQPQVRPSDIDLSGAWIDSDGNVAAIAQSRISNGSGYQLKFRPLDGPAPVWWGSGTGNFGGGGTKPPDFPGGSQSVADSRFSGTQVLFNDAGRNQQLTFTVTGDGAAIVFGNGIRWTRVR